MTMHEGAERAMSSGGGTRREWPLSGSQMGALVRAHPWASNPLGPVDEWPASLRAVVELVLGSGFPMMVLWGPELIQIYNDACRDLFAEGHPAGLGQPLSTCWPEVWHINEPMLARVWQGETVVLEDELFPIRRHQQLEQAYFTLSYSPLRREDGDVAGALLTVFETTERIMGDRRRDEVADQRFHALITASSDGLYSMSPDWTEMRQLGSETFLAQTDSPRRNWLEQYIPPEDHPEVLASINKAIANRSVFELEH